MQKTEKYELKHKFKIGKGGEQVDANWLEFTAPTNKVIRHVSVLDKELNKAMFNIASKNFGEQKSDPDKEVTGSDLIMALTGGDANLDKCYQALKEILRMTCLVDGTVTFTEVMFERMDYSDTKSLLGEYLKFFLATSLVN